MTARPAVREVIGPMARFLVAQGRTLPDFLDISVTAQPSKAP
jgi:hypothetical protein